MKLVKACIAMAVFAAIFMVPSVALAITLTSPTGTAAPVGTSLMATSIALDSSTPEKEKASTHILFTTNIGTITCGTATLTGTLLTNGPSHILGEITTVEFRGTVDPFCSSPLGNLTITPSHTSNPTHTPTGGSAHASLPWCITAGKEDRIQIWGRTSGESCHSPKAGVTAPTWAQHTTVGGTCSYEKEVKGPLTATYKTHPTDATMIVDPNQPFKKITGGAFCPTTKTLDMSFTLTTDNNYVSGSPVYIDP